MASGSLGEGDGEERARAFKTRGLKVAEAGDFTSALLLFRKALEIQGRSAALHEMCAQCLTELERWDEAFEAAMSAHGYDPQWLDGTVTLARSARNAGYLQESLQAYRTALLQSHNKDPGLAEELSEVEGLWRRDIALRVGVDGLHIQEDWDGSALASDEANVDSGAGPGGVVWDCGIALAQTLRAGWPVSLAGKRVLELGSGTGVVGIAAAASGADVTLTDTEDRISFLQANIDRNTHLVTASSGSMHVAPLDWGEPGAVDSILSRQPAATSSAGSPAPPPSWDLVIGADLVYSRSVLQPLSAVLKRVLGLSGAQFIMAHKSRSDALDEDMLSSLRREGINVRQLSWPAELATAWEGKVAVYAFEPSV